MKESLSHPCIGVFDSGIGGLSVLRELRRLAPAIPLRYLADSGHAPYGSRDASFITARAVVLSEWLIAAGARVIVVACNTATAHAIEGLRERFPGIAFVGIEPGIKPAVAASPRGRIGVLATAATVASERYQTLVQRHAGAAAVFSQACPGLAELIEAGDFESPRLCELIEQYCSPLRERRVDTALMGCTHYPLAQPLLQAALGADVRLLGIETAVAEQALRRWRDLKTQVSGGAELHLASSGDCAALTAFARRVLGAETPAAAPM